RTRDGTRSVIGVGTGTDDGAVADAPDHFKVHATGGRRGRQIAGAIERDAADRAHRALWRNALTSLLFRSAAPLLDPLGRAKIVPRSQLGADVFGKRFRAIRDEKHVTRLGHYQPSERNRILDGPHAGDG